MIFDDKEYHGLSNETIVARYWVVSTCRWQKDVVNGIFEICDIDEDVKNDGVDWIGDKELMKFVMVAYCILFHIVL